MPLAVVFVIKRLRSKYWFSPCNQQGSTQLPWRQTGVSHTRTFRWPVVPRNSWQNTGACGRIDPRENMQFQRLIIKEWGRRHTALESNWTRAIEIIALQQNALTRSIGPSWGGGGGGGGGGGLRSIQQLLPFPASSVLTELVCRLVKVF